jgi:RNA polymerase sigma factor (sigma-70 family)
VPRSAVQRDAWPADDVIVAAQQGNPEALEALILGSHPHVARFANSLCATREDAEDAAQEALTVLFRRVGSLRVAAALSSWAFQIVKNECIRRARLAMKRRETALKVSGDPLGERAHESSEDLVLGQLEAQRVAQAITTLPRKYQQVLVLRDLQLLSGKEVAEQLGMSKAAMKSTLHRARHALRENLLPQ